MNNVTNNTHACRHMPNGPVLKHNVFVLNFASDAGGARHKALVELHETDLLDRGKDQYSADLFDHLSQMPLLDLHIGPNNVSLRIDDRHCGKRMNTWMQRSQGTTIGQVQVKGAL